LAAGTSHKLQGQNDRHDSANKQGANNGRADRFSTAEFVGDASADIADRYSTSGVGGIYRDVHEAESREIGIAVFNAPEDIVGESVFKPNTGGRRGRNGSRRNEVS
jgi:hypothetical protein